MNPDSEHLLRLTSSAVEDRSASFSAISPDSETENGSGPVFADLERRFGRCFLKLQRCEQLAKAFVANHVLAGPLMRLPALHIERIEQTAKKTLGMVAGDLLRSVVVPEGTTSEEPDVVGNCAWFGFSIRFELPVGEHAEVEVETKALVALRNDLAHQFLVRHNVATPDGRRAACAALVEAEAQIDAYWARMKTWLEWSEEARRAAAECIASTAFRDWVFDGLDPDGTVHWSRAGCVHALRQAVGALAVEGWARLDDAVVWMAKHCPEQTPSRYGCRRWRQVIHRSGGFEVRYSGVEGGSDELWFRPAGT